MNLAAIQRMARQGDMSREGLDYLLHCRAECEWLDYKVELDLKQDQIVCGFAKDMLALRNVGGGYLVVGVEDKTWRTVGLRQALPYDAKLLRDQIQRAAGVDLDINIVHHDVSTATGRSAVALVLVRSTAKRAKRRAPTVVAKDFCHSKPFSPARANVVNMRREFFRVTPNEVKMHLTQLAGDLLGFRDAPGPLEYRQGLAKGESGAAQGLGPRGIDAT